MSEVDDCTTNRVIDYPDGVSLYQPVHFILTRYPVDAMIVISSMAIITTQAAMSSDAPVAAAN